MEELERMQEQKVKFNHDRYEKMQNLGRSLTSQIELSASALRRDCCKEKRQQMSRINKNNQDLSRIIWNYKDSFNDIDRKIHSRPLNNPLFNSETLKQYIG